MYSVAGRNVVGISKDIKIQRLHKGRQTRGHWYLKYIEIGDNIIGIALPHNMGQMISLLIPEKRDFDPIRPFAFWINYVVRSDQ